MFVVKPLMEDADLRAFSSLAAANEYAEIGVFQDCGCEQSEIHFVDGGVTADEAVAAVEDGLSEKRTIVHRRMSPDEIEVQPFANGAPPHVALPLPCSRTDVRQQGAEVAPSPARPAAFPKSLKRRKTRLASFI
jgi:hypothetical protein